MLRAADAAGLNVRTLVIKWLRRSDPPGVTAALPLSQAVRSRCEQPPQSVEDPGPSSIVETGFPARPPHEGAFCPTSGGMPLNHVNFTLVVSSDRRISRDTVPEREISRKTLQIAGPDGRRRWGRSDRVLILESDLFPGRLIRQQGAAATGC
jgi:hypothetical protein